MDTSDAVSMTDEERDELLGRAGTGVLSLSTPGDDPPHSIPVSYGYDPVDEAFYFRLAAAGDREKTDLLDRGVTFVVHDERDGRWRSVVAAGRLVSTMDDAVADETIAGLERVGRIPIVDVFGEPTGQVGFGFYRLDADRLTTRIERPTEP